MHSLLVCLNAFLDMIHTRSNRSTNWIILSFSFFRQQQQQQQQQLFFSILSSFFFRLFVWMEQKRFKREERERERKKSNCAQQNVIVPPIFGTWYFCCCYWCWCCCCCWCCYCCYQWILNWLKVPTEIWMDQNEEKKKFWSRNLQNIDKIQTFNVFFSICFGYMIDMGHHHLSENFPWHPKVCLVSFEFFL